MFLEERQEKILDILNKKGKVVVKELSELFRVTEDCIRKDLTKMEKRGLLKRTYGGAIPSDNTHPGHANVVSDRNDTNVSEKRMIAKKAMRLINDGDVIFLDVSTTNVELAKEIIKQKKKVKVVSNMLSIANLFAADCSVDFILIGGTLNREQNGTLGAMALQAMEKFRFDCAFLGVVGADAENDEVSTYLSEDGMMKYQAIKRSTKAYLIMEKKKFFFKGNYVYAKLEDFDGVICEDKPEESTIELLEKYKVTII